LSDDPHLEALKAEARRAMRAERAAMTGPAGAANLTTAADDSKTKVVIDAKGASKTYNDRTIIRDLNLRVTRKDRIGIVGKNGAGKSTLLKLLTGEIEPDTGSVKLAKTIDPVIIDQQDFNSVALLSTARRKRLWHRDRHHSRAGQQDANGRALAQNAFHTSGAPGLPGAAVNLSKSKAGSFAHRLGREERFHGTAQCRLIHPRPAVQNRDFYIVAVRELGIPTYRT
jgi:ATPase subunit of ABC transporter with duplicated ATPase domains